MSRTECVIEASPQAVFDVLADPRGYAYWVLGSMEVRDADPHWPEPGSRFHHTVGAGPFRVKDHTVVEKVDENRFLQIEAKVRPFGKARVKLELEPSGDGTRVTMTEDPADRATAFLFQPLMHLLVHGRNIRSLGRLAELAEGRKPMPGDEAAATTRTLGGPGNVQNPERRERAGTGAALAAGAAAGLAGAVAMSVSTNVEMRLRGRPPSDAPAKAIGRVFGVKIKGGRQKALTGLAGHLTTGVALGVARGVLDRAGAGRAASAAGVFSLAMAPELVAVPALGAAEPPWRWRPEDAAISVLHHAVFTAATIAAYEALSPAGERGAPRGSAAA